MRDVISIPDLILPGRSGQDVTKALIGALNT
jgi:hypothetical protein